MNIKFNLLLTTVIACSISMAHAQQTIAPNPDNAEVFEPIPKAVVPGKSFRDAPSDAIVLFDGKNLDEWVSSKGKTAAKWPVSDGVVTVNKPTGDIETKRKFTDFQLHIEWKVPSNITGSGQARGNSGIFLSSRYEIQVLDTYNNENKTYVNGIAGSIYREAIPLVNAAKKAGEWNVYDIAYTAPKFNPDSTLKEPGRVTIFLNGVLVENNKAIEGGTSTVKKHVYTMHGAAPLRLQAHGDKSEPDSFRNIWIRE